MTPRIRRVEVTSSTNDDVRHAAEAGEAEGFVVHALKQTAGRGRRGRVWESPEGNLYCSVLLRPSCDPQFFGQYSFIAALALFDAVHALLPHAQVTLKWPNDVLAEGEKIGGILLESGDNYLVVGMGLNVLRHPEEALHPSTSLCASGLRSFDLDAILKTLFARLSDWYAVMRSEGFAPIRAAWLERAQQGWMTVKLSDQTAEGDFIDIDAQGHLRLRLAGGTERVIASGDVFFHGR